MNIIRQTKQTLFSLLDLHFTYSQIPLDKITREQCNFSLIGGNATGTYQFQTGFYGFTDMPAEFQKAIDLTLTNFTKTYAYFGRYTNRNKRIIGTSQTKVTIISEKTGRGKSCDIIG